MRGSSANVIYFIIYMMKLGSPFYIAQSGNRECEAITEKLESVGFP
jgi:hypothetical protein